MSVTSGCDFVNSMCETAQHSYAKYSNLCTNTNIRNRATHRPNTNTALKQLNLNITKIEINRQQLVPNTRHCNTLLIRIYITHRLHISYRSIHCNTWTWVKLFVINRQQTTSTIGRCTGRFAGNIRRGQIITSSDGQLIKNTV